MEGPMVSVKTRSGAVVQRGCNNPAGRGRVGGFGACRVVQPECDSRQRNCRMVSPEARIRSARSRPTYLKCHGSYA